MSDNSTKHNITRIAIKSALADSDIMRAANESYALNEHYCNIMFGS